MSTWPLTFTRQAQFLAVAGLGLWVLSGLCQVWEVLAVQSPDSPFHLGVLAGPVAQLRSHCFGLGAVCVGLSCLWPLFKLEPGWLLLGVFFAGVVLETAALTWAAASGMLAAQVFDPRPDARLMLYLRAFGHALNLIAGVAFFVCSARSLRLRVEAGGSAREQNSPNAPS
jgi:hypothetical protein